MDAFDQRNYVADKQLIRLKATVQGAPGAVALTISVSETAAAFFSAQPAVLVGDILVAVQKPTFQTGLAISGGRINAASDLRIWLVNPTAANITPTASEVYDVVVLR